MYDRKLKDGCYFVPVSGCEEIGRNLNMFGMVKGGEEQWIIVDTGVSIEKNYGISLQIPLFDFALTKNIIGIVFTHGHDDHIGAIPFVLPSLNDAYMKRNPGSKGLPLYATKFTKGLILKKFEEHHLEGNFVDVTTGVPFTIGNFDFEMIYITHSLPEPNMVKCTVRPFNFTFVHTGDWKLDPDPVLGLPTDEDYIKSVGDKGVDLLLCDSTNVLEQKHTGSEGSVKITLDKLIKGNTGRRIIITCFASNIARVKMVHELAKKYNRKIVLFGKSLVKVVEIAMDTGHLPKDMEVLKSTDVPGVDMAKTIVICTGSQGEKSSILYRLAYGNKPPFIIKPGDLFIFSARKIPGNEKDISELQSALIRKGVEIIDSKMEDVHVSGHPSRPEIERMISLLQPKSFIPLHGTALNFFHMLKLAKAANIPKSLMPFNGAIIDMKKVEIVSEIKAGLLGLDGFQLVDMESQVIHTRKILSENGAIFLSINPGQKPVICSYGVLPDNNYKNFLTEVSNLVLDNMQNYRIQNRKDVVTTIISAVNGYIRQTFGKNPLVSVHIMNNSNRSRNQDREN